MTRATTSGPRSVGRHRVPEYFEDLLPEQQAAQRARREAEIQLIGRKKYPVCAEFGGQPVRILGPVDRFSPYREQAYGPEDPFMLMVQSAKGGRFITFATLLKVNGKALVTPMLPLRERFSAFAPPPVTKKPSVATEPPTKSARQKITL